MSSAESYFKLFDLPERYPLDSNTLDAAYHSLLAYTHPDYFASARETQKRVALQWTTRANDAYRTLKDPVQRAIHLLHLRGIELEIESNTALDPIFLTQQMEWREYLETAAASKNKLALSALLNRLHQAVQGHFETLTHLFESQAYPEAGEITRQLMFIQRVKNEAQTQLDRLNDATLNTS